MNYNGNRQIARWLGWKHHPMKDSILHDPYWSNMEGKAEALPLFTTSDAAAITLLPHLIEKGYSATLDHNCGEWNLEIWLWQADKEHFYLVTVGKGDTIAAAIS